VIAARIVIRDLRFLRARRNQSHRSISTTRSNKLTPAYCDIPLRNTGVSHRTQARRRTSACIRRPAKSCGAVLLNIVANAECAWRARHPR
jgi:hypothetical protein